MDELPVDAVATAADESVSSSGPPATMAPPSTSLHSTTDAPESRNLQDQLPTDSTDNGAIPSSFQEPQLSAQTESVPTQINDDVSNATTTGAPLPEAAKEQIMESEHTSDMVPTTTPPRESGVAMRGGRGGKHASFGTAGNGHGDQTPFKTEGNVTQVTPSSSGRGRGGGRPRGRGRGGGRGGKRKKEDRSDGDSEDSEIYTPAVTMTKSGRSVQKPASFVPPPTSPTTSNKRKRPYRRNPESAVCKVCLRGTSPASNMIVFCDGCNTPYHRFCHHPPIDQAVVDEVDKEWYCKQCEKERVLPVPESEVADFISAEGASVEQRQRYFASLTPGMLVTLLTRATTMKPDLPLFAPDFQARTGSNTTAIPAAMPAQTSTNGDSHLAPVRQPAPTTFSSERPSLPQSTAGAPRMTSIYMGQPHQSEYIPEEHPHNYPPPGHGLMRTLPPEQEDLQWLVDDDDRFGVFSHMYQVDPHAANSGMNRGAGQAQ